MLGGSLGNLLFMAVLCEFSYIYKYHVKQSHKLT